MKSKKPRFFCLQLLSTLTAAVGLFAAVTARADVNSCPTELVQALGGTWAGTAELTLPNGSIATSGTRDIFKVIDCTKFEVTVNYLDPSGKISRVLHFFAVADFARGLFDLTNGTISEGVIVTPMTGTIQVPQAGQVVGHFAGAVGGQAADLSEVMVVNGNQLTRTIQMHAGSQNGPYLGTRVVHDSKIL